MPTRPFFLSIAAATLCWQAASACVAPPMIEPPEETRVEAEPSHSVDRMAGLRWIPVEIGGVPVDPGADIWFTVSPEGAVSGRSACNSFAGEAELDAGVLEIGPLRATRMACAEPAMTLERDFLAALAEVKGFAVTPGGMLQLTRSDGTVAILLRP